MEPLKNDKFKVLTDEQLLNIYDILVVTEEIKLVRLIIFKE